VISLIISFFTAAASLFCVALSFLPKLFNACRCRFYFSAALVMYVSGLFGIKFLYVERTINLNSEPMNMGSAEPKLNWCTKALRVWLLACYGVCLWAVIAEVDAECPDEFASGSASGCHTSFEPIGVYLMFVMMGLDFVNFGLFFRRLLYMRSVAPEVQKAMIHHFKLLASVMISCVVDGTVSLAFQNEFDTMFVFLIDCAVLSLLNYLMLSTPFSVCCHRPSIRLCRSCKCKCKICPTDAEAQLADNINHNSTQTATAQNTANSNNDQTQMQMPGRTTVELQIVSSASPAQTAGSLSSQP